MGKKLLIQNDERVGDWVKARVPTLELGATPYTGIGLLNEGGQLIAGVVYDTFVGTSIDMHVAAVPGRRWMSRRFLGEVFRYPFMQLGVRRVTGRVPASNEDARRFDEHIGFKLEGVIRKQLPNEEDLLIYGMLKEECRWLKVGMFKNGR